MIKSHNLYNKWNKLGIFLLLCFSLLSPYKVYANEKSNLDVYFMYVGQGDGILLKSNGKYMLIDCGPKSHGEETLAFLKKMGVTEFEYVITTHGHQDHLGGFLTVLQEIPVKKLFFPTQRPPISLTYNEKFYSEFCELLSQKNIVPIRPYPGDVISFGTAKITFLAPKYDNYKSYNNSSIVVKVENGQNSFLFTGDAEVQSEQEMIADYGEELQADVLKIGHHSSETSTSLDFLKAVNPSCAVISCGLNNKKNCPRERTMKILKGTNVYRTDLLGTIHFHSNGTTITVNKHPNQKEEVDITTGELNNIYNTSVTSNVDGISLMKLSEKSKEPLYINEPLTLKFSANFGISKKKRIRYMLVPKGSSYRDGIWHNGNTITIKKDFHGVVYVQYENMLGDQLVKKTNEFIVDTTSVQTVRTISSSNINFYSVDETIPDKSTSLKKQLQFTLDADFGLSKGASIEYQLVEDTKEFDPKAPWQFSNEVSISGPFHGYIYAKFTDRAGNTAIYRSDHIKIEGETISK